MNTSSPSNSWRPQPSLLSSRKNIWETFPVSLVQLGRSNHDGAERHAVVWNRKRIVAWRETCPDPNAWYLYEKTEEARLIKELMRSNKWVVEPRQRSDQICVIRMEFRKPSGSRYRSIQPYTECVPILTRLKDITTFFPMVQYHEVGDKIYALQFSTANLQDPSLVSYNLYKALQASTAWTVLPSMGGEMCRIAFAQTK